MSTDKDYVLGTHDAEIERLGLQHRVWRPHASAAWRRAGFAAGQTLLDVGSGPGYASLDLAEIVGPAGRVHALDRSRRFLDALGAAARARGLGNIEAHELDLDECPMPAGQADGAWSRWVYAFVRDPRALLARVAGALRPGGVMVLHEYCDYRTWRVVPRQEAFEEFVSEVMASWRESGGEPDIGLALPGWLEELDCTLVSVRAITEVARPGEFVWEWPQAFVAVGLAHMVDTGRVAPERAEAMLRAFRDTASAPGGWQVLPTVIEIVARRQAR